MLKFYFPYMYGFASRSKTILHKGSFVILIVAPILFTCAYASHEDDVLLFLMRFVLAFTAMYSVYEIGYLYNDVITTKYEKRPSYWLPKMYREYIEKHFELLITSRLIVITVCLFILKANKANGLYSFIVSLIALKTVYALHNKIRNKWNILTNFGLQMLKYCSMIFIFVDSDEWISYFFIMFLEVPLIRTIEFMAKKRLEIDFMKKVDISKLRIVYHLMVCFLSGIIYFLIRNQQCIILLMVSSILLIFRIISYLFLKNEKIRKVRYSNFKDVK